jgi:hypothetical protein
MRERIGQPVQPWSHIKHNIEMREGIGQQVQHWSHIKHNIEMREGIGQPVQHWPHIVFYMWSMLNRFNIPSLISCALCVINVEPIDLSLPVFLVFYVWSMLNRLTYPFPNFYIV